MNKGGLLERLRRHQEDALAIMGDTEPMLAKAASDEVGALARARWALMRTLIAYQHFKHRELFDPAIARNILGEAQRAARMKQACMAMGEEFRDHISLWSRRDVGGEWATYQPAALSMMAKLRKHLAQERAEIETLVDKAT